MKIAALCRTLNEAGFIAGFCQNHQFCDAILIADGGSVDNTAMIARSFNKVEVREFEGRAYFDDGSFMNPEPAHMNFLLDWADEIEADWVIISDCDAWPNKILQKDARGFIDLAQVSGREGVLAHQLYMWGNDFYFPKINVGQAPWAFRTDLELRYDESGNTFFDTVVPGADPDNSLMLEYPNVLMHYFSDPQRELEKIKRYEAWGHPKTHVLDSIYAPPAILPDWAQEYKV